MGSERGDRWTEDDEDDEDDEKEEQRGLVLYGMRETTLWDFCAFDLFSWDLTGNASLLVDLFFHLVSCLLFFFLLFTFLHSTPTFRSLGHGGEYIDDELRIRVPEERIHLP